MCGCFGFWCVSYSFRMVLYGTAYTLWEVKTLEKRDILIIALIIGLVLIVGFVIAQFVMTLTVNMSGNVTGDSAGSVVFDGIEYTSTQTISFNYGTLDQSEIVEKPLVLKNLGNTLLSFNVAITGDSDWLTCNYDSGSIAAYHQIPATLTLTVPSDAPAGPFSYQVVVTFG